MYERNRPAIALILPPDDPWLPDDPRARDARLEQQLAHLERVARRARRRMTHQTHAGPNRDHRHDDGEDDNGDALDLDSDSDDVESELKPRNGLLC